MIEIGKVYTQNIGLWRFRWRWWLWEVRSRIQYWLTGDCGNWCEWVTLYMAEDGEPCKVWIPEAECPIHDAYR